MDLHLKIYTTLIGSLFSGYHFGQLAQHFTMSEFAHGFASSVGAFAFANLYIYLIKRDRRKLKEERESKANITCTSESETTKS